MRSRSSLWPGSSSVNGTFAGSGSSIADGFNPIAISYEWLVWAVEQFRNAAGAAGRDAGALKVIEPACPNLINEASLYRYSDDPADKDAEVPVDDKGAFVDVDTPQALVELKAEIEGG